MILIILGLFLLIAAGAITRSDERLKRFRGPIRGIGMLILLIGIMVSGIQQIDAGEVGVKKLFGKVQKEVLGSGLHFINPLLQIEKLDVKTRNYTMSGVHNEGAKSGDDAIKVLTADGLEVTIDLSVLYRVIINDAPMLLQETGADYEDKIVRPITRTRIRDNAVYYDAVALYSTKRDEFQQRIFKSIEADFKKRGLLLENLLVRNITLPQSVRATIEQKINAEQDAQKMQFVLQKERQEAERKRVEAQGIADYQRIISESLTDRQLQYESIKAQLEIAKSANTKVIIMGKGSSPVILDSKTQ
ncbi:prohibitin family protein [Chitinophaga oryziterrae]|uniref:Prohibitin family protein n=1 Tax=Chitinophaga oryziterrae TaxID=1031224 RepID=A0A6N8J7Q2_9BACT|nr:prohibitin family protein [Chitinophaga oryziterrae]MVT41103.1 prohibitin family protein [Chitinophaga oryziterrae]